VTVTGDASWLGEPMAVPTEVSTYQCRSEGGRIIVEEQVNGRTQATLALSAAGRVMEAADHQIGLRRRAMHQGNQVTLVTENLRTRDSRVVGTATTNASGTRIQRFSDAAGRFVDVTRVAGQIQRVSSHGGSLTMLTDARGRAAGETLSLAQTPDQGVTVERSLDECGNVIEGATGVGAGAAADDDWRFTPAVVCRPEDIVTPELAPDPADCHCIDTCRPSYFPGAGELWRSCLGDGCGDRAGSSLVGTC
jgi:hypothetical protein